MGQQIRISGLANSGHEVVMKIFVTALETPKRWAQIFAACVRPWWGLSRSPERSGANGPSI